jgi:hypothetical protein
MRGNMSMYTIQFNFNKTRNKSEFLEKTEQREAKPITGRTKTMQKYEVLKAGRKLYVCTYLRVYVCGVCVCVRARARALAQMNERMDGHKHA